MNSASGILYIVATPIGNLQDITYRAIDVLKSVDFIAAEDTRHSHKLMSAYQVHTRLIAYHAHNEQKSAENILGLLSSGKNIALISDAGTPLISDPGYILVRDAHKTGIKVIPIPGPSALIAGLSAAGMPTQPVSFYGFLPAKSGARGELLTRLASSPQTMVFYETPHRILAALADIQTYLGADRQIVFIRELTKTFETILSDTCAGLLERVNSDADQQKGEMMLVVAGAETDNSGQNEQAAKLLRLLLPELPLKTASKITSEVTGMAKNQTYELALTLREQL